MSAFEPDYAGESTPPSPPSRTPRRLAYAFLILAGSATFLFLFLLIAVGVRIFRLVAG